MLTNSICEQISINIKRWREFKGIKQEELAKKLKITAAALSNIENGKIDITISRIQQIAEALQLNFEFLLSSPQEVINTGESIDKAYTPQRDSTNLELINVLKTELSRKNEQIEFLQHLLRSK